MLDSPCSLKPNMHQTLGCYRFGLIICKYSLLFLSVTTVAVHSKRWSLTVLTLHFISIYLFWIISEVFSFFCVFLKLLVLAASTLSVWLNPFFPCTASKWSTDKKKWESICFYTNFYWAVSPLGSYLNLHLTSTSHPSLPAPKIITTLLHTFSFTLEFNWFLCA